MIQVSAVGNKLVTQKRHRHKHKQSEIKRQKLRKELVNKFQRLASNRNNLRKISLSAICECYVGATAAQVCTSRLINDETRQLSYESYKSYDEILFTSEFFYSVALCAM